MEINDKCVGVIGLYRHRIKIVGYGIYKGIMDSPGIHDKKKIYSHVHQYIEQEPYMQLESGMVYSAKDVRIISVDEFKEIRYATLDMYGKVDVVTINTFFSGGVCL